MVKIRRPAHRERRDTLSKPHATPHDPEAELAGRGDDIFKSILLPAAAAITLMVLFFTLLLSGPLPAPAGAPAAPHADATPIAVVAPPTVPAVMAEKTCEIPAARGLAGVVAARFEGKRTSSGERYRAREATCMVNAASALASLKPGTAMRVTRSDDANLSVVCRIAGTWNGGERSDRLVLLSGALARQMQIGERGLADITTGCPDPTATGPTLTAELGAQ